MLTDTMIYGPQTPEVEALLERARTLTDEEKRALYKGWSVEWNTAWNAGLDAALGVARYAWQAEVWNTALGAVLDAALALVVRDLITPDGFTQAHYDQLTGPWRRVIGKVHPDDAEVL